MSTPAGWHQQPDGRERYWDGQQWTDQYREGGASAPPPPATAKKSGGCLKWVLIAIAVLVLLGVLAALLGGGDDEGTPSGSANTSQTTEDAESPDSGTEPADQETETEEANPDAGDENNPVEIVEGEAFEIRGFAYSAGWTIGEEFDMIQIEDLKVTNNRGERDSALVTINFMKGTEVLASADCTSDPIQPGTTVTLNCFSADALPSDYDRITINDMF